MPFLWRSDKPNDFDPNGFQIPKHLHYLWGFLGDDGPLPGREQANFDRWTELNPDWQTSIQTPASVNPVVDSHPRRELYASCLLYTSPSPRDRTRSRMPSSA